MTQHIVTRTSLSHMIIQGDERAMHAIGRALVHLYNRQTSDEQSSDDTKYANNMGFTGGDAREGSLAARYYLRHKKLLPWQMDRWTKRDARGTPRLAKYWRQLDEEAHRKAQGGGV